MSNDGCLPVAWQGQAFPYMLHRPDPHSHRYGDKNTSANAQPAGSTQPRGSDVHAPAASGTWNGPAPAGQLRKEQHGRPVAATESTAPQPRSVRLGSSRMPLLIANTAGSADEARGKVKAALEAGVTAFDVAMVDGTAAAVGEALQTHSGSRDDLFIISKVWNDAKAPSALTEAVEANITDLACGHLDLLLIHWPATWLPGTQDEDTNTKLAETWAAMEALVSSGKVKQLGVANFSLQAVEGLLESATVKPVCNLVELHPQLAQRKLVGTLLRKGVQCIAHSATPAAEGDSAATLAAAAELAKRSREATMIKWSTQRGVPVVLDDAGAVESTDKFFSWKLNEEQAKVKLDSLDEGKRLVQPVWASFADAADGGALKPSSVFGTGSRYV